MIQTKPLEQSYIFFHQNVSQSNFQKTAKFEKISPKKTRESAWKKMKIKKIKKFNNPPGKFNERTYVTWEKI